MPHNCITCSSEELELVFSNFRQQSARFVDHPVDVLICRACGLVSLDTSELTDARLAAYYSTFNHFEKPGPLVSEHRPMREGQVAWVMDRLPADAVVQSALEIGCGTGFVLKLLRDRGLSVEGVDYSPTMIRNLKTNYGIEGTAGAFSTELIDARRFDLIVSFKVLEHLLNPNAAIAAISRSLNEGGLLGIEVPDSEFPKADQLPDFFAFDHLYHFTVHSLGAMMERNGFEVLDYEHFDFDLNSGTPGPAFRMLARKSARPCDSFASVNEYAVQRARMFEYRDAHDAYVDSFQAKIDPLREKVGDAPLAIYCGGEHTANLLDRIDFEGLNVEQIFDGDVAIAGGTIAGIPIKQSSEIPDSGIRHFLMSTTNHERSIHCALKTMDPNYQVYGLYQDFD